MRKRIRRIQILESTSTRQARSRPPFSGFSWEHSERIQAFKLALESGVALALNQQRASSITTERDEVEDPAFLVADESFRHDMGCYAGWWSGQGWAARRLRFLASHPFATVRRKDGAHSFVIFQRRLTCHPPRMGGTRKGHPSSLSSAVAFEIVLHGGHLPGQYFLDRNDAYNRSHKYRDLQLSDCETRIKAGLFALAAFCRSFMRPVPVAPRAYKKALMDAVA